MKKCLTVILLILSILSGIAFVYSCGDGGNKSDVSAEGYWIFHLMDEDASFEFFYSHLTVTQTGSNLTAEFSCDGSMPVGYGTADGNDINLTFDFGSDGMAVMAGSYDGSTFSGTFTSSFYNGQWYFEESVEIDCSASCDPISPEKFVDEDFTDLGKVREISLFRSGEGHDYSDFCESCRSMKHYFAPYSGYVFNDTIEIYSPVDGTITAINTEMHGDTGSGINKQVHIRSTDFMDYTFVLFHMDLTPEANSLGKAVQAGDLLGHAHMYNSSIPEYSHDFDIAVSVSTIYGQRYISYFEVMTDTLFADYEARGAVAATNFVITSSQRDAAPMTCDGETFTNTSSLNDWFVLDPKGAGANCVNSEECTSNSCSENICIP